MGGLTPEILNVVGKASPLLRTPIKILADSMQSPEIMRTPEYWLDGAFTQPPKIKTHYLIRPDSYRDNKPLGDVLFRSEGNAKIRAKYEDENGNPPEDFKWGLSPDFSKNTPFLKLDHEYLNSPTYDKYREYQQAVFDDRYRYADFIFTVAEIAFLGAALKKGANLAVLPAKIALSPVSDAIDAAKPFAKKWKRRPQIDTTSKKAIDLMNTPDANLSAENVVNKKILTVVKKAEDFDKKINLDSYEFVINEYLSLSDKIKNSKLIPVSWFNSFTGSEVPKVQKEAKKLYEYVAENSISGQIKKIKNNPLNSPKDRAMLNYLEGLDTKKELSSLEDFIIKTPASTKFQEQKGFENITERYFSGLETTPQFNEVAKYLDTDFYKLSEMGDSLNPNKALFSSTDYSNINAGYNLYNIDLGISKLSNYKNLPKDHKLFEFRILSDELYRTDKTGRLAEKLGLSKSQLKKPIEDIVLNLEEIKRIAQAEKITLKTKIDNLKKSNILKLSPFTGKYLDNIVKKIDPRRVQKEGYKVVTKKEQTLFGKSPSKETITIPEKDLKSVMSKEESFFIKDGSKFEEKKIREKLPVKDPDTSKRNNIKDQREPDIKKFPESIPTEKPNPDASKAKKTKDPDASKAKKTKDPDASKLKDAKKKKSADPEDAKKKKSSDPEDAKKKKKKIKEKDGKKLKEGEGTRKKRKKKPDPETAKKKRKKKKRRRKDLSLNLPSGGDQGSRKLTENANLFPSVVQWKDGEEYITYNLHTKEKKIRDFPALGGVKEGDTPSTSLKIIRKSNLRPKGLNRKIGNLTLQIKSPEVVTVKKLEKKIYNNNKELSFRR